MEETSGLKIIISWLPMLMYIVLMILFLQKMGQMNQHIERIARALEGQSGVNASGPTDQ